MYLFPHNKHWQSEFELEKQAIVSSFATDIEIYHIGSTAVKDLYAKDCLDLLGVVKNIAEVNEFKQGIVNLGYAYKGEYGIAGRAYFSKKQRKVHLHIFQRGDQNIAKHLAFVNTMQGNAELIEELNQLKQALHAKFPHNKDAYQNEKACFYQRINKMR